MKIIFLCLAGIFCAIRCYTQNLYTKDKVSLGKKKDFVDACIRGARSKVVSLKGMQINAKNYCECMAETLIPVMTSKELMKISEEEEAEAFFANEKNLKIILECLEDNYKFDDTFAIAQAGKSKITRQLAVRACVDEIKTDTAFSSKYSEQQMSTYCLCAIEKLFNSQMKYKDLSEIEEIDGVAFNELVLPCALEAGLDMSADEKEVIPQIVGNVAYTKIDLIKNINKAYKLKLNIGGVVKYFTFDTGASDMIIDKKTEEEFLAKGILKKENYLNIESDYMTASNEIVKGRLVILNNIQIGDYTVNNLTIAIIEEGSLLLGKSLLDIFSKWEIQKEKNILILYK